MIAHIPFPVEPRRLRALSEANPGWKIEREPDGSVSMSPPVGTEGGLYESALTVLLARWNRDVGHGYVFSSQAGFTMPDDSLLCPDGAWIRAERYRALSEEERQGYARIVPDACIEVVSRWDWIPGLKAKLQRFRRCGAQYVLLVDPYERTTWSQGEPPEGFPTDFTEVFDAAKV